MSRGDEMGTHAWLQVGHSQDEEVLHMTYIHVHT